MQYASNAMSCVADRKATSTASMASGISAVEGDSMPIAMMVKASSSCVTSIQPRRRPSKGGTYRSTRGAQRNLMV
ncbi:hypothetical protein D3C72_2477000 [compost metagenome]